MTAARTLGAMLAAVSLLLAGCATTPEGRLRRAIYLDVYVDAAHTCEKRFGTLRVTRVTLGGDVSLDAAADSRSELAGFRTCYREGIRTRVAQLRTGGREVPPDVALEPDVEIE